MKNIYRLAFAAAILSVVATPAAAAWQNVGRARFDRDDSHASLRGPTAPARTLSFTARGADVYCREIRVTFRNGDRARVFSGRLERGRSRTADLPGRMRHIRRIDLRCRAQHRHASVDVSANIRAGWGPGFGPRHGYGPQQDYGPQRGPGPRMGGGGVVRPDAWHRWHRIATERFEGRGDREASNAGWNGRRLEQIALRPANNDAVCSRLAVRFANGRRRDLNIGRYRRMERGLFYIVDLPGDRRHVERIWLRCHARGGRHVRIEIWGKRGG